MVNGRRRAGTLPPQASDRARAALAAAPGLTRLSRYTAENQYGMVGFGAGPAGSTIAGPDTADAAAGITGGMSAAPASNGVGTLVLPANVLGDPAFWMVATLGAILALAAYSAGPSG